MVSKFAFKFLFKNYQLSFSFIEFKTFLAIIDESKLCRKLIFSLIGKENSLLEFLQKAIYLDFLNEKTNSSLNYIRNFVQFLVKKLESPYCLLLSLIILSHSLKIMCPIDSSIEKDEFLKLLDEILCLFNHLKDKTKGSSLNIILYKMINSIIYEIILNLIKKDENLQFKSDVFCLVVAQNIKQKTYSKLEKKTKYDNYLCEIPHISLDSFFSDFLLKDQNFSIQQFSIILKNLHWENYQLFLQTYYIILRGFHQNCQEKKEEITKFVEEFEEIIINFIRNCQENQEKLLRNFLSYIKKSQKIKNLQKFSQFYEGISASSVTKILSFFNNKATANDQNLEDIKIKIRICKYVGARKDLFDLEQNFNQIFNKKTENELKFFKYFCKYLSNSSKNPFDFPFFSYYINEIMQNNQDISIENSIEIFNILKLGPWNEAINSYFFDSNFLKIKKYLENLEITHKKGLKALMDFSLSLKHFKKLLQLDYFFLKVTILKKILLFLKSLKLKEIEQNVDLQKLLKFLSDFCEDKNSEDIVHFQEIIEYLIFSHSKICENIAIFLLNNAETTLFSFMEKMV